MIEALLQVLSQLRVLHWQATNYNHHVIYGNLYESLDSSVDELLETMFGQGIDSSLEGKVITLANTNEIDVNQFFSDTIECLTTVKTEVPSETNIVDAMIDEINKSIYLLKMN